VKVVSVQLADNDMDNYVLAVAKKKIAVKMMKELSDIVGIVNSDNYYIRPQYMCYMCYFCNVSIIRTQFV